MSEILGALDGLAIELPDGEVTLVHLATDLDPARARPPREVGRVADPNVDREHADPATLVSLTRAWGKRHVDPNSSALHRPRRGTVVAFAAGRPTVWRIGVVVHSAAGRAWVAYVNPADLARVDADRVPVRHARPATLFPVPARIIHVARARRKPTGGPPPRAIAAAESAAGGYPPDRAASPEGRRTLREEQAITRWIETR